jgi:hypothetical protein
VVDRIQKTGREEHWKVSASSEAKKDKRQQGKDDGQDQRQKQDSFGESSDFIQLLAKDPRKYKSESIAASQIKGFTFRSISTDREKAILEVDISLTDGGLVRGAQIALSRQEGMQYLSRKLGDEIVTGQLATGTMLTIALPQKIPTDKNPGTSPMERKDYEQTAGANPGWYYYLILAILLSAMMLLLYVFLMV